MVLSIQPPRLEDVAWLRVGAATISLLQPATQGAVVEALATRGITTFSLELLPRIGRAQSMDALSSQASLAGYKAVLMAANRLGKFFPMLTTAADRPFLAGPIDSAEPTDRQWYRNRKPAVALKACPLDCSAQSLVNPLACWIDTIW